MQPIVVREMPEAMRLQFGTEARLEIVAGERRWRAANIAGLPTVPVLLRDLTDEQVISLQIIENLQREGLSAIEEAEGYEVLRKQGMTAAQIGSSVGKSKAYIHAKLKLLALGTEGRDKLRAGELTESAALLVARVPASLQARALARVCETDYTGNRPSVRTAAAILQRHFTKDLTEAWFIQTDAHLAPNAGPCTTCPKRLANETGNEDDADVCTDPDCFEQKQSTHKDRLRAEVPRRRAERHRRRPRHDRSQGCARRVAGARREQRRRRVRDHADEVAVSPPFDTRFATCDRCASDDIVATVGAAAVCRWCMEDAIIAIKYQHAVNLDNSYRAAAARRMVARHPALVGRFDLRGNAGQVKERAR